MKHLKKKIKESLKTLLAVLAGPLLLTSILACQYGPVNRKNEIWLIDPATLVLYRVISDTSEQTLEIKNNPAMKNFMCVDKKEADRWLETLVACE